MTEETSAKQPTCETDGHILGITKDGIRECIFCHKKVKEPPPRAAAAAEDPELAADVAKVQAMIDKLPAESRTRVEVVADILRDLINADDGGHEVELAFTPVLAERAAL